MGMGNGISVKADLAGCKRIFLVPLIDNCVDGFTMEVVQELKSRGIKSVQTITMENACLKFAEIQQRNNISADQKFLRITQKGKVIQLFR